MKRSLPYFLVAVGLLPGCSDYRLHGMKDRAGTDTGATTDIETDRLLDTGPDCPAVPDLLETVATDESCRSVPVFGTLDAVVEWELSSLNDAPEYAHVLMTPVVGPLLDGDGDGDVDAFDPPSVVVVTDDGGADAVNAHGVLRIVDGRDGTLVRSISVLLWGDFQVFPYRYSNAALGDIDGDGRAEIVVVASVVPGPPGEGGSDTAEPGEPGEDDTGIVVRPGVPDGAPPGPPPPAPPPEAGPCRAAAYAADGSLVWLAEEPALACGGHAPALADLEGDGTVEVIVGANVFDGATGAIRFSGALGAGRVDGFAEAGWMSLASDLDGNGTQEVVTGSTIYAADGSVVCDTGESDGFPAVADLDGDGAGEVVVVSNGTVRVFDGACVIQSTWSLGSEGIGGPPTLGDLDGDGLPEIGVASAEAYSAFEADGTPMWSMPISDSSSSTTGASFYDFDGDGVLEVVYADELALWLLDGATGAVRLMDDTHSSRTLHELPVVVDVDGDGRAEIVVPNGGTHSDSAAFGLYVLGSADGNWPANRAVWNQHAYSITNIDDDLSVPASPVPNWPTWNTFRSGVVDPVQGSDSPDAVPLAEVCAIECETGTWVVNVGVGNQGLAGLRSDVPVTLYAGDTVVETQWTTAVVVGGGVSEPLRFSVPVESLVEGMRVVVDDDGRGGERVVECVELNNALALTGCE
ncbi:MAG: VCBS repeat-containing protein [Pseudomonadota bacterium]|nr:VCBS repeat-containing protein [Pseudomonadota bacterium]